MIVRERLHTADHILGTILRRRFGVKTRALEFGEDSCRIVYESETDLRPYKDEIEKEENEVISKGYDVVNYTVPRSEATDVEDLSLIAEDLEDISVYEIVGFNKVACGGPHVKNTKEVGRFEIISIKKKGKNVYSFKYTVKG